MSRRCVGRRVSAFVDGEVSAAENARIVAHLGRCENCRRAVAAERITKQLISGSPVAGDLLPVGPHRSRRPALAAAVALVAVGGTSAIVAAGTSRPSPPALTPPIAEFSNLHYGVTITLPAEGPALGVMPAAFRSPGP